MNKNLKFSPLFWPITYKKDAIYILDETLLPEKTAYIKVRTYQQACSAIKQMKTRAVGQVILVFYTFLLVLKQNKGKKNIMPVLKRCADSINSTRPTLPFKFLTDMVLGWAAGGAPLESSINGFLEALKAARVRQAEQASALINDGDSILTHCNISGLLPLIGEFCRRQGKHITFFATETRPYLQGARLTAWELKEMDFDVAVIADNTAAHLISEKMVNKIIVGADQLAQNGDIANKIGTHQLAIIAKHFNIPFYVLCPPASRAATGKDIKIEIRPQEELLEYRGMRLAPKGAKGFYPAFDVTPANLITRHIYMDFKNAR